MASMNSPVTKAEQLFKCYFIRTQRLFLNLIVRMADPKFSFWKFMFLMLSSRKLNCLVRVHFTCSTKCRTQVTFLILSWGYHMSISDKGGTNFLFSFESIDLLASCNDSGFCVVIDRSMGYYCKGIHDNGGTISQRLFNSNSKNKDCVMGSDYSKVFKCEVSFDHFMIIDREDAGNFGLHHLGACMDKNRKNERKFTLSRFETGCCVVCYVVPDYDYCKGIRDKGGGKLYYGLQLFEKMRIHDVVSWTSIITTYVWTSQEDRAIKAFIRMQEAGVSPNEYTFACVISIVANLARVEWGEQLQAHVLHSGLISLLSVGNSIVTIYAKCERLASGSKVFHEMNMRYIVSWSTLIAGYSQGGYEEEAFQFSSWMRREGPKPNEFALTSVLSVCGSMAMLEQGKQLHAHVLSVGLEFTSMVQSAIVNMYSKHGSIKEVAKIFDVTELSDIISRTTMINGYAEHGFYREAIDLFMKIPRVGLKPYLVTFISIIVPYCHAGLVDLGFHYNSMRNDFGINPAKEHYGCMVDLLYRVGRLGGVKDMIKSMPFQQDVVVWPTLLRACRLHGDVECGRRAADEILKLDPSSTATHITLANMYVAEENEGKR